MVNFEKAKSYYFDVDKETIYGKVQFSKSYYHELQHYRDYKLSWYRKLNDFFDMYVQFYSYLFVLAFLLKFTASLTYLQITFFFLPYALFRVQEEVRAYIYAWKKTK